MASYSISDVTRLQLTNFSRNTDAVLINIFNTYLIYTNDTKIQGTFISYLLPQGSNATITFRVLGEINQVTAHSTDETLLVLLLDSNNEILWVKTFVAKFDSNLFIKKTGKNHSCISASSLDDYISATYDANGLLSRLLVFAFITRYGHPVDLRHYHIGSGGSGDELSNIQYPPKLDIFPDYVTEFVSIHNIGDCIRQTVYIPLQDDSLYGHGKYVMTTINKNGNYNARPINLIDSDEFSYYAGQKNIYDFCNREYAFSAETVLWDGTTAYNGEWFQIELPDAVKLGSYSIQPHAMSKYREQLPMNFVLLGSMDELTWVLLDERHDPYEQDGIRGSDNQFTFVVSYLYKLKIFRLVPLKIYPDMIHAHEGIKIKTFIINTQTDERVTYEKSYPPTVLPALCENTDKDHTVHKYYLETIYGDRSIPYGHGTYTASCHQLPSAIPDSLYGPMYAFNGIRPSFEASSMKYKYYFQSNDPASKNVYRNSSEILNIAQYKTKVVVDGYISTLIGEWLQIEFPESFVADGFTIAPFEHPNIDCDTTMPREFVLLGSDSNDNDVPWEILPINPSIVDDWNMSLPQQYVKTIGVFKDYFKYRIIFLREPIIYAGYFAISNIQFQSKQFLELQTESSVQSKFMQYPPSSFSITKIYKYKENIDSDIEYVTEEIELQTSWYGKGKYIIVSSGDQGLDFQASNIFSENGKSYKGRSNVYDILGYYTGSVITKYGDGLSIFGEYIQICFPYDICIHHFLLEEYNVSDASRNFKYVKLIDIDILTSPDGIKWTLVTDQYQRRKLFGSSEYVWSFTNTQRFETEAVRNVRWVFKQIEDNTGERILQVNKLIIFSNKYYNASRLPLHRIDYPLHELSPQVSTPVNYRADENPMRVDTTLINTWFTMSASTTMPPTQPLNILRFDNHDIWLSNLTYMVYLDPTLNTPAFTYTGESVTTNVLINRELKTIIGEWLEFTRNTYMNPITGYILKFSINGQSHVRLHQVSWILLGLRLNTYHILHDEKTQNVSEQNISEIITLNVADLASYSKYRIVFTNVNCNIDLVQLTTFGTKYGIALEYMQLYENASGNNMTLVPTNTYNPDVYTVRSSSFFSESTREWNPFMNNENVWMSQQLYSIDTGLYYGSTITQTMAGVLKGEWIEIILPRHIQPMGLHLTPINDFLKAQEVMPLKWYLLGLSHAQYNIITDSTEDVYKLVYHSKDPLPWPSDGVTIYFDQEDKSRYRVFRLVFESMKVRSLNNSSGGIAGVTLKTIKFISSLPTCLGIVSFLKRTGEFKWMSHVHSTDIDSPHIFNSVSYNERIIQGSTSQDRLVENTRVLINKPNIIISFCASQHASLETLSKYTTPYPMIPLDYVLVCNDNSFAPDMFETSVFLQYISCKRQAYVYGINSYGHFIWNMYTRVPYIQNALRVEMNPLCKQVNDLAFFTFVCQGVSIISIQPPISTSSFSILSLVNTLFHTNDIKLNHVKNLNPSTRHMVLVYLYYRSAYYDEDKDFTVFKLPRHGDILTSSFFYHYAQNDKYNISIQLDQIQDETITTNDDIIVPTKVIVKDNSKMFMFREAKAYKLPQWPTYIDLQPMSKFETCIIHIDFVNPRATSVPIEIPPPFIKWIMAISSNGSNFSISADIRQAYPEMMFVVNTTSVLPLPVSVYKRYNNMVKLDSYMNVKLSKTNGSHILHYDSYNGTLIDGTSISISSTVEPLFGREGEIILYISPTDTLPINIYSLNNTSQYLPIKDIKTQTTNNDIIPNIFRVTVRSTQVLHIPEPLISSLPGLIRDNHDNFIIVATIDMSSILKRLQTNKWALFYQKRADQLNDKKRIKWTVRSENISITFKNNIMQMVNMSSCMVKSLSMDKLDQYSIVLNEILQTKCILIKITNGDFSPVKVIDYENKLFNTIPNQTTWVDTKQMLDSMIQNYLATYPDFTIYDANVCIIYDSNLENTILIKDSLPGFRGLKILSILAPHDLNLSHMARLSACLYDNFGIKIHNNYLCVPWPKMRFEKPNAQSIFGLYDKDICTAIKSLPDTICMIIERYITFPHSVPNNDIALQSQISDILNMLFTKHVLQDSLWSTVIERIIGYRFSNKGIHDLVYQIYELNNIQVTQDILQVLGPVEFMITMNDLVVQVPSTLAECFKFYLPIKLIFI